MAGMKCVVYDRNAETVDALVKEGAVASRSLAEVAEKLNTPRAVWIMLPSGAPTEETIVALSKLLAAGDAMIDGGDSCHSRCLSREKSYDRLRNIDAKAADREKKHHSQPQWEYGHSQV
jgi:6-phosphogluconate dehydrogenase